MKELILDYYFDNAGFLIVVVAIAIAIILIVSLLFDDIENRFKRIFKSVVAGALIIVILLQGAYELRINSSAGKRAFPFPLNTEILENYECMSEEVEELTDKIKEDYGVEVYININPKDIHGESDYRFTFEVSEEEAIQHLKQIHSALGLYNRKALRLMPKKFYIVSDLEGSEDHEKWGGYNSSYGYLIHENDYIVICSSSDESAVHHEIMHSLDKYMNSSDLLTMIEETEKGCSLVSDYACTNYREFIAESWKNSFVESNENKYYDLIRSYYSDFLRGFSEDVALNEPKNEVTETEEYVTLNKNEKNIYRLMAEIKPSETLKTNGTANEVYEAKRAFMIDHPECLTVDGMTIISDGDTVILYLDESIGKELEEKEEAILPVVEENIAKYADEDSYEQLLGVYRQLKDEYFGEAEDTLYLEMVKENPNKVLRLYLSKLGYTSSLETQDINNAVIIKIEDNYYWMSLNWEKEDTDYLYAFLVSDDFFELKDIYVNNRFKCEDMSLSYAAKYELVLEEFDATKIDKYLVEVFRRPKEQREVHILCKGYSLANEVMNYIVNDRESGYSRFAELWFENISNYSPGYLYNIDGYESCVVEITNFVY